MSGRFTVSKEPLDVGAAVALVSHGGAGAVDVFLGVVRDHNEGRAVTRLEYEAYEAMAVREMERIGAKIEADAPGVRVAASHRTGSRAVGELAVVCAASAPHRAEAFAACRRLIDDLKASVPVWKREWGPDGPYWVGWQDARCTHGHEHEHEHGHEHGSEGAHAHDAHHADEAGRGDPAGR